MIRNFIKYAIRGVAYIFWDEFAEKYTSLCSEKTSPKDKANVYDFLMLNSLRSRHLGKRCFILGNGPSLNVEDINKLKNEYTFASNKIYLIYDKTTWRPTYYSAEDPLVVKNNNKEISSLKQSTKLFPAHMLQFIKRDMNSYFIPFIPQPKRLNPKLSDDERDFSLDLVHGINWGSTITYSMLQMAVFMGFKTIYLLGVDHTYVVPKKMKGDIYISDGEINHFHKDYRKPGEEWNDPKVDTLTRSYEYAEEICSKNGVKVYNASRKTALNAFETCNLDDIL